MAYFQIYVLYQVEYWELESSYLTFEEKSKRNEFLNLKKKNKLIQ